MNNHQKNQASWLLNLTHCSTKLLYLQKRPMSLVTSTLTVSAFKATNFFLHGPDTFKGKYVKMPSVVTNGFLHDSKPSVDKEASPASKKVHATPTEAVAKAVVNLQVQLKENVRQTLPKKIMREPPPEIAISQDKKAAAIKSGSMLAAHDLIQSKSYFRRFVDDLVEPDSEECVDDFVEPDERLESRLGFDVLVDDKLKYKAHEDDEEYLEAIESEHKELDGHFVRDDFAEPAEYDPAYPATEHFYEGDMIDSYHSVDGVQVYDDLKSDSWCTQDRMLDSALSLKRKLLSLEIAINDRRGVDLRDCLIKCRISDGHAMSRSGRTSDSLRLRRPSKERSRRNGVSKRLRERLVLEVENIGVESLGDNGTLQNGGSKRGLIRISQLNKFRHLYNDTRPAKRQFLPSEVSRRPGPRDKQSSEEPVVFSGPKTPAQLQEEKKKAEAKGGSCTGVMGQSSRTNSPDFEGPKPLSDILKDKRRLGSVVAASES